MERQKKVVDASIIVKWFLIEEKREKAIELREKHIKGEIKIIVPELLFLELLNALKFKGMKENDLKEVNKLLFNFGLTIESINEFILEKATQISFRYNLTLYDALYAALALIHACPLITDDEKLKKFSHASSL